LVWVFRILESIITTTTTTTISKRTHDS